MSFQAVGTPSSVDLGTFLKIYSTNGVYNNLSTASDLWKYFLKLKARDPGGRQLKYLLRTGYGPGAVQAMPVSEGDYPAAQRSSLSEATANYKDFGLTVSVPRTLLNKTGNDLIQYADPLTEELDAKSIVAARVMSAQMMGDGTGVIGVVSGTPTTAATRITIKLSTSSANAGKSHIGWFMEQDKIKFANSAAAAQDAANTGDNGAYYQVETVNSDTDTITVSWRTSAGVELSDITGAGELSDGDYIYRYGTTPQDLSDAITDYGSASECLVGLESLAADDSRVVHGLTMSGTLSGSWKDCDEEAIDPSHFQNALSKTKRRCGKGRYKYKQAFMYDTIYDALVEARETDRRFQTVEDGKRGVKMLGYQHANDFVEFVTDEFVPKQRVWILPESKDVLEFHGRDFEVVEPNKGQKFQLATASSGRGHSRTVLSYMEGAAVVIAKHPAAICALKNFTA